VIEYFTLGMQIAILIVVAGAVWSGFKTRQNIGEMLRALYEYRREISWMTARLEALENQQKAKGQGNVRAENGRRI
jgi:hypothetical protein